MQMGQIKRTRNKKMLTVCDGRCMRPWLVSCSITVLLGIIHPTMSVLANAPAGRSTLLVRVSKFPNSVSPKNPIGRVPMDRALSIPMMQHKTDTPHAALLRLICISSFSIEVPISCIEIVLVRAAIASRTKKSMEMT